ncbi:MAG: hypothetical protein LBQ57_10435, partial [Spirochaetales bacterium]|nr:hypothetical protein [Spirochaetales bacterium]
MKKAKYPVSLLVMFIVGLTTCRMDMGLGPSVDLEGPSLSISSPANRDFVNSVFDITGICSDNVNVTRVVAEDIDTRLIYPAEITGGTWRIHIDMPTDKFSPGSVEKTFRITAYDAAGNTSNLSVAQITLRVDLTPPFLEELAI